jgi:hypothetical protein
MSNVNAMIHLGVFGQRMGGINPVTGAFADIFTVNCKNYLSANHRDQWPGRQG